jgi:tetratricopeptide (TPR) repeat protein
MKRFPLSTLGAAALSLALCGPVFGQPAGTPPPPAPAAVAAPAPAPVPADSGLDAALFYQLLLGELNARGDEPTVGFTLMLDAARKSHNAAIYERAMELALQSRNAEGALQAARAWKQAFPQSREANRFVLQILVALNRIPDSAAPLKTELELTPAADRGALIAGLPRIYARASDKKQAATVVEQALGPYLANPNTAAAAWSAAGRLRLAAGDTAGAMDAARRGHAANPQAEGPALLALELMDPKQPEAEVMVRKYLDGQPLPEIRMGYARALLDTQRTAETLAQLQILTRERPDYPEAWLVQGSLLVQDNQLPAAEAALKKYLELVQAGAQNEDRRRGTAQAYLALSQIAERRRDFAQANAWLDRIENSQDLLQAQNRRASILARQGKLEEARNLLRALPERNPADARMKTMAEVALLRENKQYQPAYELLAQAIAKDPADTDLLYDQAMLAEKMGRFDDMEKLLRQLMARKPDYHHAYNALGFSLAERNQRLPEAKQLIQKALEFAPGDPFISDSLAWVEFRMGNSTEALRILRAAYKERPDPEIAAHLGEVLWTLGQRDQAQAVWREGMLLNAENETLVETLKRLRVQP